MNQNDLPEGFVTFEAANANRLNLIWEKGDTYQPKEKKLIVLKQIDIRDLEEFLDWNLLFASYNLNGRYPKILKDATIGEKAQELLDLTKDTLIKIKKEGLFKIDALFKNWKAYSEGNSIIIEGNKIDFFRQQAEKKKNQPNHCLSDFIAPTDSITDYIGGYAISVSAKSTCPQVPIFKAAAILLTDAARKYFYSKIRTEYWAYAKREKLSTEEILKNKYQGIIIPVGHAALPNTESKRLLSELLNAEINLGRPLMENEMVNNHEFGWCFSHTESKYFGTGKLGDDQIDAFLKASINDKATILKELEHLRLP
jgi:5-methyltetrahydrofolate--homocysteine methyltransferase